jgi:hypothetical protein
VLKIENVEVVGLKPAIRGMRNAMNSWDKSDSGLCKGGDDGIGCVNCATPDCFHCFDGEFKIGKDDYSLMQTLRNGGSDHRKYMRMIIVYFDVVAPLYWWKEFDTYKVGTVANSCSTMHKIHAKEFTLDDFSYEHLSCFGAATRGNDPTLVDKSQCDIMNETVSEFMFDYMGALLGTIIALNSAREQYLKRKDKQYWWQMIQLLPSTYNQRRTIMLSYEVLANQYNSRVKIPHKLDEWHTYGQMIENLPYSGLITGKEKLTHG